MQITKFEGCLPSTLQITILLFQSKIENYGTTFRLTSVLYTANSVVFRLIIIAFSIILYTYDCEGLLLLFALLFVMMLNKGCNEVRILHLSFNFARR